MRITFPQPADADNVLGLSFAHDQVSVRFIAQCNVRQLYLMLCDASGVTRAIHQMNRTTSESWSIELDLSRGSYLYHYCAIQDLVLSTATDAVSVIIESTEKTIHVHDQSKRVDCPQFIRALVDDTFQNTPSTPPALLPLEQGELHC